MAWLKLGTAGRRCADCAEFLLRRIIPEDINDVGFPVGGPVSWIGGIQSGFAVGVTGILRSQIVEVLNRRVARNGLRIEFGSSDLITGSI